MRIVILLTCVNFFIASCNHHKKEAPSFWQQQKSDFKHKQKNVFVSDSVLRSEFATLKAIVHPLFDFRRVYLYSWQERDETKTEFTVVEDDGELGLKLLYVILDKNDSLLSATQVAGLGREADMSFETSSRWISKDTVINTGSITKYWDLEARKAEINPRGDTTFTYYIFGSDGKVTKKVFKEVKALDYEKFIQAN